MPRGKSILEESTVQAITRAIPTRLNLSSLVSRLFAEKKALNVPTLQVGLHSRGPRNMAFLKRRCRRSRGRAKRGRQNEGAAKERERRGEKRAQVKYWTYFKVAKKWKPYKFQRSKCKDSAAPRFLRGWHDPLNGGMKRYNDQCDQIQRFKRILFRDYYQRSRQHAANVSPRTKAESFSRIRSGHGRTPGSSWTRVPFSNGTTKRPSRLKDSSRILINFGPRHPTPSLTCSPFFSSKAGPEWQKRSRSD